MGSKVLPKTADDKALSIRHLDRKIALDRQHAAEHRRASKGPSDAYNNAHAAEHAKSLRENQAQRAKVAKKAVKADEKTAKKRAAAGAKTAKKA